jgi:5-methylcytosine-specific restriction enzyme subunit McrC
MSADILSNQILKATLKRLLGEQFLDKKVRAELRKTQALLPGVGDIELNARVFHQVRLHQNNRLYLFLINICRFFYESLEAQDRPGSTVFETLIGMRDGCERCSRNSSEISFLGVNECLA